MEKKMKLIMLSCSIGLLRRLEYRFGYSVSRTAVSLAHKIHGKCSSSGIPLFVLHGLLGSKKNWESISKKLASTLKTCAVVPDARNHGESPHAASHTYPDLASDVVKLMDNLSYKKIDVVGHSMGGRTAMVMALTEPDKVRRLIVVDISPVSTAGILNNFFPKLIQVMKSVSFDGVESVNEARNITKNKFLSSGIINSTERIHFILMNIVMRHNKKIEWAYNLDVLEKHFQMIATFPKEMLSRKFEGPTLFIGGGNSNYIPSSDLDGITKLFPDAQLKYIPNVGHNPHAEDPNAFFELAKEFLVK